MSAIIETLIWRASLATAPALPQAEDLADWAAVLAAGGEQRGGTLLEDVAALWRGFPAPGTRAAPAWTIDILFSELDELGSAFSPHDTPPPPVAVSGRPDEAGGIGPATPVSAPPADPAAAASRLRALLSSQTLRSRDEAEVLEILNALTEAGNRLRGLDYRTLRDLPLGELASAIAVTSLAHYAAHVRDLAVRPLGSVAFLHRAARLDPSGAGPYFSAIGRVARNSGDVFQFARRAAGASGSQTCTDAWIALLGRGCHWHLLAEVIDDLGDADRLTPLALMLDHLAVRRDDFDLHFVRRVRDAALDNASWPLAIRAQAMVTRLRPDDYHELFILGSIQATAGDYGPAEWTFRECNARRPEDSAAALRLYATRHDRFDGFEVLQGLESPLARRDARLRRRGIQHDHGSMRGERMTAVDV